MNTSCPH